MPHRTAANGQAPDRAEREPQRESITSRAPLRGAATKTKQTRKDNPEWLCSQLRKA